MTEYVWIMIGGFVGIFLAAVTKNNSRGKFFSIIIGGVGLLFVSGYFLQSTSPTIFQGLMIVAALFSSLGLIFTQRQQVYR